MPQNNKTNKARIDFRVSDIGLADWGNREIAIAETEVPGLMSVCQEYAGDQPLEGARIAGSSHMTIQTAVLIETLQALGAEGCATGHPSYVMSTSCTHQVLAQIELWTKPDRYEREVYTLPKALDKKVAVLHLAKVGAEISQLTQRQADYIGVPQEGQFKSEAYRY